MLRRLFSSKTLIFVGCLFILVQVSQFAYFAAQGADIRPVIAGTNNDAANAIDVAGRSQLYRDNGFAGYGPVYFKISNLLAAAMPNLTQTGDWSDAEGRTKTLHFSLILVSALSIILLAAGWSYLIVGTSPILPLIVVLIGHFLTISPVYRRFVFVAHPDHLLSLFVAVACYLSFRSWESKEEKWSKFAAWAWGVALATKMSVVLFYPFAFLGYFVMFRPQWKLAAKWIGHSLLAYLVAGFPQNFNFPRTLRFLSYQSQYSQSPSVSSVVEWFKIYWPQVASPLLVVLLVMVVARTFKPEKKRISKLLVCAGVLAIGPFLALLTQNINAPHEHYTMPFVAAHLTLLVCALNTFFASRVSNFAKAASWIFPSIVVGHLVFAGVIDPNMNSSLKEQMTCRAEARTVYKEMSGHLKQGKKVFADPYVPTMDKTPNLRSSWRPTQSYIVEGGFNVLVLNANHNDTYFRGGSQQDYIGVYNADPNSTKALYSLFRNTEKVDDKVIGKWERVYTDSVCSWQIWIKK